MIWLMLFVKVLGAAAFFLPHSSSGQNPQTGLTCRYESSSDSDKASRIMYNQQSRKRAAMRYHIIAAEACEPLARRMEEVRSCYSSESEKVSRFWRYTRQSLTNNIGFLY